MSGSGEFQPWFVDGGDLLVQRANVYGAVRGSTGPSGTKHKFVGQLGHPSEDETGLVYMRARYMDPVTGRFVSKDPERDGHNWYGYAHSRPTNLVDLSGGSVEFLSELLRLAVHFFNEYLDGRVSRPFLIATFEFILEKLGRVAATARAEGALMASEAELTAVESSIRGDPFQFGARIADLQRSLAAKSMAYGAVAQMAGRAVEVLMAVL